MQNAIAEKNIISVTIKKFLTWAVSDSIKFKCMHVHVLSVWTYVCGKFARLSDKDRGTLSDKNWSGINFTLHDTYLLLYFTEVVI